MKNLLAVLAVVGMSTVAFATGKKEVSVGGRPTIDGCGLGWEVTDSRTMIGTTTRETTNAFIPPTFGMTTGTLGCEQLSFAKNDVESASFIASNFEALKSELAEGRGETVSAALESMGCSSARVPAMSSQIQSHYDQVVAPAANATELFNNLKSEVGTCGA